MSFYEPYKLGVILTTLVIFNLVSILLTTTFTEKKTPKKRFYDLKQQIPFQVKKHSLNTSKWNANHVVLIMTYIMK